MEKVAVTIAGAGLIALIYWFFFGKRSGSGSAGEEVSDTWTVIVDGGYKPNNITIPRDKPTKLTFTRNDPNRCLEEVVIPDFKIKEFLPLNEPITITLSPTKAGTFGFHCGMNMFHGRIEVAG